MTNKLFAIQTKKRYMTAIYSFKKSHMFTCKIK